MASVSVNGVELFYMVSGDKGPAVLFMHGGLGLDHTYFRPWLDPLATTARLVHYDHRGNGRSTRTPLDDVTHASWAADADGLRAHLGIERLVLFGHSYGSFIALEYALAYPERLAGLVLCGTAPVFDDAPGAIGRALARAAPEQSAALDAIVSGRLSTDEDFRRAFTTIWPLYFHRPDPAVIASLSANTRFSLSAYLHSFGRCLPSYDVRPRLGELRVPTLIICGDDDWITPPSQAERVRSGIAGSELAVIEQAGHYPFVEKPTVVLEVIRGWMERMGIA